MAVPSVRAHHNAVLALLQGLDPVNFKVYDGEVDPKPVDDPDHRVHPYAVLYSDPGRPWAPALCHDSTSLAWTFEVVCVGGDQNRCLWAVDKVRASLTDAELAITGRASHKVREDYMSRVRVVARDDVTRPARFEVSLLFRADSHAA